MLIKVTQAVMTFMQQHKTLTEIAAVFLAISAAVLTVGGAIAMAVGAFGLLASSRTSSTRFAAYFRHNWLGAEPTGFDHSLRHTAHYLGGI